MGTDAGCGLTRALDEDELYLSHTAHVDGTLVASTFAHLGSFSDGTHQTGDAGCRPSSSTIRASRSTSSFSS